MMKIVSLAALVASASAFAPSQTTRSSSSALTAKPFADEIGAQMPVSYSTVVFFHRE